MSNSRKSSQRHTYFFISQNISHEETHLFLVIVSNCFNPISLSFLSISQILVKSGLPIHGPSFFHFPILKMNLIQSLQCLIAIPKCKYKYKSVKKILLPIFLCIVLLKMLVFIKLIDYLYLVFIAVIYMQAPPINEDQIQQLLDWIDTFQFSRLKKNITRDFSDGVLMSEIMKKYFPTLVQLHNYPTVSAVNSKFNNWKTLNKRVFQKLRFTISNSDIQGIVKLNPGTVERVLYKVYRQIQRIQNQKRASDLQNDSSRNKLYQPFESKQSLQFNQQLAEKDETIKQLKNTIQILQTKMLRMQELNRLKDAKIDSLLKKLEDGLH